MDYAALIIFLMMHYVRPQEWSGVFMMLRPVQVLAVISVYAIYQRKQKVRIQDFWSAPQDYMVSAYFVWTILASPTPKATFTAIFPVVFFYFVGVLTLNSVPRLKTFLVYWACAIVFVATMAVLSTVGIDPLGSYDITQGVMKGRLMLNLSIFNNPNALGHAMVPVFPLLYYLLFWKKTFSKVLIVIVVIPVTCILMTLSKGAFICSAVTIFATLTFGRPKTFQITMAVLAALFGGTVLYALPRMTELNSSKNDPAIQGRVAAFKFGLDTMRAKTFGHGLGNFQSQFFLLGPTRKTKVVRWERQGKQVRMHVFWKIEHYYKAPHSAYNQNGADLGFTGLALFIGVMYCSFRTLLTAKTVNDDEEILRRSLFAIVLAYAVSSWMVDFCYRPTFFLFTAATSAFHRYLRGAFDPVLTTKEAEQEDGREASSLWPSLKPLEFGTARVIMADNNIVGSPAVQSLSTINSLASVDEKRARDESTTQDAVPHGTIEWRRIGLIDVALTYLLAKGATRLWAYAIEHM